MKRLQSPQSIQSFDQVLTLAADGMAVLDLHSHSHPPSQSHYNHNSSHSDVSFSTEQTVTNTHVTDARRPVVLYSGEVSWVDGVICTLYLIPHSPTTNSNPNSQHSQYSPHSNDASAASLLSTLSRFVTDAAGWATSAIEWRNVLHGGSGAVVAVLRDVYTDIVGSGALVSVSPHTSSATSLPTSQPWLTSVVVADAYRGIGLGSYVVRVLSRAHRHLLFSTVRRNVPSSIPASVSLVATPGSDSLYARLGFRPSSAYSASIMSCSLSIPINTPIHVDHLAEPVAHPRFGTPLPVSFATNAADPSHLAAARYCASVFRPAADVVDIRSGVRNAPTPRLARFFDSSPSPSEKDEWACAVVTDPANGDVTAAAWATFYTPLKRSHSNSSSRETASTAAFIGPVVADDTRLATAVVARLVAHLQQTVARGKSTAANLDVGMVALNVHPARPAALVWSSSAARFRAAGGLSYMVRTQQVEVEVDESEGGEGHEFDLEYDDGDEEEDTKEQVEVEMEHELKDGEWDACDTSKYFCLAGYNG